MKRIGIIAMAAVLTSMAASGAVVVGSSEETVGSRENGARGSASNSVSDYSIRVIRKYRIAIITAKLERPARIGVTGFTRLLGRRVPRGRVPQASARRFVGRVPLGRVGRDVDVTWDLRLNNGTLLPKGNYEWVLRVFSGNEVVARSQPFKLSVPKLPKHVR
jgi:hypothetical protein